MRLDEARLKTLQKADAAGSLWGKQKLLSALPAYMGSSDWMYHIVELVQKICDLAHHFIPIPKLKQVGQRAKDGVFVADLISILTADVLWAPFSEVLRGAANKAPPVRTAMKMTVKLCEAQLSLTNITEFFWGHSFLSPGVKAATIMGSTMDFYVSATSCYRAYSMEMDGLSDELKDVADHSKKHHFCNAVKAISSLASAVFADRASAPALAANSLLGVVAAIGKGYYSSGGLIEPFDD